MRIWLDRDSGQANLGIDPEWPEPRLARRKPQMELWTEAYRSEFGSDPEDDMAEHSEEIEAWRASWQGGYDAREEWALALLSSTEEEDGEPDEEEESG